MQFRRWNIQFRLNIKKTFKVLFETPYVIKLNDSPTKGLLIDTYLALPNPFLLDKYRDVTFIADPKKHFTRVMVARHWPREPKEDHMQILLSYLIPYREYTFRGEREYPPGNFKIIETGTCRIFDVFVQNYFFVFILSFQKSIGFLNPISKGATYALYLDLDKMHDMSTIAIKRWNVEHIFLRLQKLMNKLPNYEYNKEKIKLNASNSIPLLYTLR